MVHDRTFRFANDDLNKQLIACLHDGALDYAVRPDGAVGYRSADEDRFEDVLARVRDGVFTDWQVFSFPPDWLPEYRAALARREVAYEEEINDGAVEFLLDGSQEPHEWRIEKAVA